MICTWIFGADSAVGRGPPSRTVPRMPWSLGGSIASRVSTKSRSVVWPAVMAIGCGSTSVAKPDAATDARNEPVCNSTA